MFEASCRANPKPIPNVGAELFAEPVRASQQRVLPPLAQVAIDEGESIVHNLQAELDGKPLEAFTFRSKGFVVSVGVRRGVADVAGQTFGGKLAHLLKDAIEWEYRASVKYLRGWSISE